MRRGIIVRVPIVRVVGVVGVVRREAKRHEIKIEEETVVMAEEPIIVIEIAITKEPIIAITETAVVPKRGVMTMVESWSHGAVSWSHAAVSWSHSAVSWSHGAVSWSHGAVSSSHAAVPWSHGAVSSSHGAVSSSHAAVSSSHGAVTPSHMRDNQRLARGSQNNRRVHCVKSRNRVH